MHAHIRVTWCGADLITWQELLLLVVVVVAALHSATCMLPVPLPPPQGPPLLRGSEALEGWESTLFHARHLRHAAEDLGAAMYPPQVGAVEGVLYRSYGGTVQLHLPTSTSSPHLPCVGTCDLTEAGTEGYTTLALLLPHTLQDLEEVGGAALAVMDVTQLMCDEFPAPDAIGGSELVALCDELGAAHSVLAEQLADAQASANNSGGGVQPDA